VYDIRSHLILILSESHEDAQHHRAACISTAGQLVFLDEVDNVHLKGVPGTCPLAAGKGVTAQQSEDSQ
jgi:hypothetical protein